ncbi:MAG: hypothetical protein QNJ68_10360 [Microcoleaceae cyanobacterium MO_207.B10]|nr:hypothetical protein [Microcoleaceae cyanobacterium MO_207.B10]
MPTIAEMSFFTFSGTTVSGGTGSTYGMTLSNKYTAIAEDLGLTKAASEAEAKAFKVKPRDAIRQGVLISLRLNYRKTGGKRGSANVYCHVDKVANAIQSAPGKDWGGATITSLRDQIRMDYR